MNVDNSPTTPEEDFAFTQLEHKLMNTPTIPTLPILPSTHIPLVEISSTTIHSHTGAQYQPMNTSPNAQPNPQHIINQIAALLSQLVSVITPAPTPQPNFQETIETILEQANWFEIMLDEKIKEAVEDAVSSLDMEKQSRNEVEDMIGGEVEHYMRHTFDIEQHVNIAERVRDVLDDTLDDALNDKLEDALTDLLSDKTITINL